MILAIDIGNTNTVFGIFKGEELFLSFRIKSDQTRTTDEYASSILFLIERSGVSACDIKGIVIASVVPSLSHTIDRVVRRYFPASPLIIDINTKTDIAVKIENPKEVGIDRIVNSVAAVEKYNAPCIIIDFGTATTFDIVNKNAEYIGGVIYPGVMLSAHSLHQNTAKLPDVNIEKPKTVVGKNTIHSMQSGLYYGYLELINGLIKRVIEEEFKNDDNLKIILTGGLGTIFANDIYCDVVYEPQLTLYGLKLIYDKNK